MTEATPKRRRARKPDGKFQGNNPATETNEAWEPVPVEDSLVAKNQNKYEVRPKVAGISANTAGKYAKKSKVSKPGVGNTRTTYN